MNNKINFVNLHCHTGFSIFDGFGTPETHIETVFNNEMNAMAITEHGNMNSFAQALLHQEKMLKEGKSFKLMFGSELYYIPSLREWRDEYNRRKEEKKKKSENEEDKTFIGLLKGKSHMLVLAQNQEGLNNLYQIISLSNTRENFYRLPRIDFDILKKYNKGLIVSSACVSGFLAVEYFKNKETMGKVRVFEHLSNIVQDFLDVFGNRFYGELQWNSMPEQHEINQIIISLSQKFGFEMISTCDSHYPTKDSWIQREIYKRLGWLGNMNKPDFMGKELPKSIEELKFELYPKTSNEVWESFQNYSKLCNVSYDENVIRKSLENTNKIAFEQIEDFSPNRTIRLPSFVKEKNETSEYTLSRLAIEGLKKLGLDKKKEYVDRLKKEIKTIQKKNFSQYFLTMRKIVELAKENYLTGPARGSAASSLLSYCLGITQVDPLRWDLQFERFLSIDSVGYPDIDFDVQESMELKEIMSKKWGEYSVIPVSNFITLQLRSLVKDVSKFFDVPYQEVNEVTSKMLFEATPQAKKDHDILAGVYTPTFKEVKKYSKSFKEFLEKYPHVANHIEALSGQNRQCSRHASGVCIGEDLNKYMPLISSGGILQTPWPEGQNARLLEPMGFIKFDILGLASLRMMRQAIELILKRYYDIQNPSIKDVRDFYDNNLHPDKIDFTDQNIYQTVFHKYNFHNVFQFQEKGIQAFCVSVKPKSFEDIINITSIYRPSPLSLGYDKMYVGNKENPKDIVYDHPLIEEVLEKTFGLLIFQEQIAELAHKLGKNISLEEGNQLRKLLVKKGAKKEEGKKEKIYKKFIEGCVGKGLEENKAQEMWKNIEKSNSYLFCKSHAVSYSVITFQTAWMLTYYPIEWACAFLEKDTEFDTKKEKAIAAAKQMGFEIEEANINTSKEVWEISKEKENTLIQPLSSIKGLGDIAIKQIIDNRYYNTIEDLIFNPNIPIAKLNKKCLEVLIKSQSLNHLMDERFKHLRHFYLSICDKRPTSPKELEENILIFENELDFTEEEKIGFYIDITGIFPIDKIVSDQLQSRLKEKCIPPISEYDEDLKVCWGVVRDVEKKYTFKGKEYYNVSIIDSNFSITKIKCWGVNFEKDVLYVNRPYMMTLKWDSQWGFSTNGPLSRNWRLLG